MAMTRFTVDMVAPGWVPRIISENPSHYRGYSDHGTLSVSLRASEALLVRSFTDAGDRRGQRLTSDHMLGRLTQLLVQRGAPHYVRSANRPRDYTK